MEGFAHQLARLRAHVAANRPLPLDLGFWAIDELSRVAGSSDLKMRRNGHLRRAGAIIGGSRRQRAMGILKEAAALERCVRMRSLVDAAGSPLRREVEAARLIAPIPAERQLREILGCDTEPVPELAVEALPIANVSPENLPHEHTCDSPPGRAPLHP